MHLGERKSKNNEFLPRNLNCGLSVRLNVPKFPSDAWKGQSSIVYRILWVCSYTRWGVRCKEERLVHLCETMKVEICTHTHARE